MRSRGSLGSAIRTVWPRVGYMDLSATSVRVREPSAEQLKRAVGRVLGKFWRREAREGKCWRWRLMFCARTCAWSLWGVVISNINCDRNDFIVGLADMGQRELEGIDIRTIADRLACLS